MKLHHLKKYGLYSSRLKPVFDVALRISGNLIKEKVPQK